MYTSTQHRTWADEVAESPDLSGSPERRYSRFEAWLAALLAAGGIAAYLAFFR